MVTTVAAEEVRTRRRLHVFRADAVLRAAFLICTRLTLQIWYLRIWRASYICVYQEDPEPVSRGSSLQRLQNYGDHLAQTSYFYRGRDTDWNANWRTAHQLNESGGREFRLPNFLSRTLFKFPTQHKRRKEMQ